MGRRLTPNKPKQFCAKGHDMSVPGGRRAIGGCALCERIRDKERYIPHVRSKDRFCPYGHDTSILVKIRSTPHPKKQFCLRGHDTFVTGRDSGGRCRACTRDAVLKRIYNITSVDYDKMLNEQNDRCAICGGTDTGMPNVDYFCIDHDHSCCSTDKTCGKCIRGLLCNVCNSLVGFSKENVGILLKTIEYLNTHNKNKLKEIH
jgi:hypothetical protein